jgi:hypothetical protein
MTNARIFKKNKKRSMLFPTLKLILDDNLIILWQNVASFYSGKPPTICDIVNE